MSAKISCKQAVDYISKKEEGKLTGEKRFRLWQHLGACSLCRRFSAQNKIMSTVLAQMDTEGLSREEKEAILAALLKEE